MFSGNVSSGEGVVDKLKKVIEDLGQAIVLPESPELSPDSLGLVLMTNGFFYEVFLEPQRKDDKAFTNAQLHDKRFLRMGRPYYLKVSPMDKQLKVLNDI